VSTDSKSEVELCPSCGSMTDLDPCSVCGVQVAVTTVPLTRVGRLAVLKDGLAAREALIVGEEEGEATLLLNDGNSVTRELESLEIGESVPGIDQALSPAGQQILLATSANFESLRGNTSAMTLAAVSSVANDINGQRLLAIDALRVKGLADSVLPKLSLNKSEIAWLRANAAAQKRDWEECFASLSQLPDGKYAEQWQLYLAGREALQQSPQHRKKAVKALKALGMPETLALADWLEDEKVLDPAVLAQAAQRRQPRIAELLGKLESNAGIKDYVDLAPEARALDALRNPLAWPVTPEDIRGRSLTYVDELIERGQLSAQYLPDFRAVLGDTEAAYITARLDPRQLSDDEIEQYGPQSERERRDFIAGKIKLSGVQDSESVRTLQLVDDALKGSHEALAELRSLLDPDDIARLEAACATVASGSLPEANVLSDRSLWQTLERGLSLDAVRAGAANSRDSETMGFVSWVCLRAAKVALHAWDWEKARELAEMSLQHSQTEAVSDEALNIMAGAYLQLGKTAAAYGALEKALEGEYNSALQSNAVAAAASAAPEQATLLLSRLVSQAPDLDARVAAAKRAIWVWTESQGAEPFPAEFIGALRSIVVEHISLDDFTEIAVALADQDANWFTTERNLSASPHRSAMRTKLLIAREQDYEKFVRLLARALNKSKHSDDPWIQDQRDVLVQVLLHGLHNEQEALGYANVATEYLDADGPMDVANSHELRLLSAREFCFSMDATESCLKDERVAEALVSWQALQRMSGDDSERLRLVAGNCMNVIGNNLAVFHMSCLQNLGLTSYEFQYGPPSAHEKVAQQTYIAREWLEVQRNVRPTIEDSDLREFFDNLTSVSNGILREEYV
jgi:tetratricopeptide (TPR) repeat protein